MTSILNIKYGAVSRIDDVNVRGAGTMVCM